MERTSWPVIVRRLSIRQCLRSSSVTNFKPPYWPTERLQINIADTKCQFNISARLESFNLNVHLKSFEVEDSNWHSSDKVYWLIEQGRLIDKFSPESSAESHTDGVTLSKLKICIPWPVDFELQFCDKKVAYQKLLNRYLIEPSMILNRILQLSQISVLS